MSLRGPEHIRPFLTAFLTAFPDIHHTIHQLLEDDGTVAVEASFTATHTGPLATPNGEIPPTGRPVEIHFAALYRIEGDVVTSVHAYWDQLDFMTQLGPMPSPATT